MRIKRILIVSAIALIFSALFAYYQVQNESRLKLHKADASVLPGEVQMGTHITPDFSLQNAAGETVGLESYGDSYKLVLFGYTYCPDFCPTELQIIAASYAYLTDEQAKRFKPLFVTIDPARDTSAQMADYVALFHPKIEGLTGTKSQLAAAIKNYAIYSARVPGSDKEGDDYLIDHSTFAYLVGPDNELITVIRHGTSPEMLAGIYKKYFKSI